MSLSSTRWANRGAYGNPFSGTGMEFLPLGVRSNEPLLELHEAGYLKRRPFWNYSHVFSPFWRLYYDLQPGHVCVFPDRVVPLGPDRLVLIPDHCLFHTRGTESRPKFWLAFSYSRYPAKTQSVPLQLKPMEWELVLIRQLIRWLEDRNAEPHRSRIQHGSLALLQLVLSRPEITWQPEQRPKGLAVAVDYIEHHLNDPLYNPALAGIAGMSTGDFARQFKRHYHVAPAAYVAQLRVRAAAHLLIHTRLSLDEIAERTGFPNRDYFSRVFRRVSGGTPAHFRRQGLTGANGSESRIGAARVRADNG